tara:strand:- start:2526 stop:3896 length:1371 start_codon:yes stop_codon:yes gene_type:complete
MIIKPKLIKGTRDFNSIEIKKREYIINIIRSNFELYSFEQINTPAIENLSTLSESYGEEGDRLIFKIINSGDYLKNISIDNKTNYKNLLSKISKKALRYDLTIPLARYVAMNQNNIVFPLKRFQIQNVWRADRPQKGRFTEFLQCDADIIGSKSLLLEIELIQLYTSVFKNLNLPITIKLNNRKILLGICEHVGESDKFNDLTIAIDKLDRYSFEKVQDELFNKGFSKLSIIKLKRLFDFRESSFQDKILFFKNIFSNINVGMEGINEVEYIFSNLNGIKNIDFDIKLARGLSYYTGTILEVVCNNVNIGSIGGGGRYDNLTEKFGLKNISGVGISFGLDRIYLVMEELNLFPKILTHSSNFLFLNFGDNFLNESLKYASILRENNISCEIFPDNIKLSKQLSFANKKNIPFIIFIGDNELKNNDIVIKDMRNGNQQNVNKNKFLSTIIEINKNNG